MPKWEECVVAVAGMHCGGCEARVQRRLQSVPGVHQVAADHAAQEVRILFEPAVVSPGSLQEVLRDLGYEVRS